MNGLFILFESLTTAARYLVFVYLDWMRCLYGSIVAFLFYR